MARPTVDDCRRVARTAQRHLEARIEQARTGTDGEWRNHDVRAAFLQAAQDIEIIAWGVTFAGEGIVRACAARIRHGRTWSYLGGEALTATRTGTVRRVDDYTFELTFTI